MFKERYVFQTFIIIMYLSVFLSHLGTKIYGFLYLSFCYVWENVCFDPKSEARTSEEGTNCTNASLLALMPEMSLFTLDVNNPSS